MARTASIGIRVKPAVKQAAESKAKEDRRTLAAYIELLIIRDLEESGHLPKGAAE